MAGAGGREECQVGVEPIQQIQGASFHANFRETTIFQDLCIPCNTQDML